MYRADFPSLPDQPYIFLGGTCGGNDWRADFSRSLSYKIQNAQNLVVQAVVEPNNDNPRRPAPIPDYLADPGASSIVLDPRVEDWTPAVVEAEKLAKRRAAGLVFYLGDPYDTASRASMYSGAEAMLFALKRPRDTALILDVTSPWSQRHDDKQRLYLAEMVKEEAPEVTISWNIEEAAQWAARKLLEASQALIEL